MPRLRRPWLTVHDADLLDALKYLRVAEQHGDVASASYPFTITVASVQKKPGLWLRYYVDTLPRWRLDGVDLSLARKRHRMSEVVDAETLGPLGVRRRLRSVTRKQRKMIRAKYQENFEHWAAWASRYTATGVYRTRSERCFDWLFGCRTYAREIMSRSETEIVWLDYPDIMSYCGSQVITPTVPNLIRPEDVPGKVVFGYAKIDPTTQALNGMVEYAQRVFTVDYTVGAPEFVFGVDPLPNYRGLISIDSIHAGRPALAFQGKFKSRIFDTDYETEGWQREYIRRQVARKTYERNQ